MLKDFPVSLDDGEQQAMQLALNRSDSLLIMDDRLARREALQLGISFIGTARVAWLAEKKGLAADARKLLVAMAEQGYFISPDLLLKFE
jgi:predicted nucleic acid-binding protein